MIIDFHTHMFPDKIAGRTLDYLSGIFGASPFADGTYTGLCNSMGKGAVDISIALPAVTKVSQVAAINRFASAYTEGPVISFGGIHPECENYKEILKEIKNLGLKGIKLHPDYQDMYFDNIRYERIIDAASELGLITVVHAGVDPKCPEDVHCTPEMARKVLDDVKPEKLVLAHMGGNEMWDDVERYLVGQNVYFDTGVILNTMPQEQFLRIVHMHGADRILFGTDSPWADQKNFVALLEHMPLTEEENKYARNPLTHVDFLLFNQIDKQPMLAIEVDGTGFHEAGSKQAERDIKKNSILEKCAVPLLRLRTDGSGEKEKIRNALKRE